MVAGVCSAASVAMQADWVELEDLFKVIQCSVLSSALFTVLDILDLVLVL